MPSRVPIFLPGSVAVFGGCAYGDAGREEVGKFKLLEVQFETLREVMR